MIILKSLCSLLFLLLGLGVISAALRGRRISWYPKWLWILELIVGIVMSLLGFRVWFV
jgi:hydrogenase/urease accessory protein HupE